MFSFLLMCHIITILSRFSVFVAVEGLDVLETMLTVSAS